MKHFIARTGAMLLLVSLATVSLAHTTATTSPKNGAVLAQSPPVIDITFQHEARLTSVVVVAADKSERKLEFAPQGSAKTFKIANANLSSGQNEIQWKALSKDGHVVSGKLTLKIEAPQKAH